MPKVYQVRMELSFQQVFYCWAHDEEDAEDESGWFKFDIDHADCDRPEFMYAEEIDDPEEIAALIEDGDLEPKPLEEVEDEPDLFAVAAKPASAKGGNDA